MWDWFADIEGKHPIKNLSMKLNREFPPKKVKYKHFKNCETSWGPRWMCIKSTLWFYMASVRMDIRKLRQILRGSGKVGFLLIIGRNVDSSTSIEISVEVSWKAQSVTSLWSSYIKLGHVPKKFSDKFMDLFTISR